jgi:hypothetical protein
MKLLLEEHILSWGPNSTFVSSSAREPSSMFVPTLFYSSSGDDSEDENPPPPDHLPPNESIEPELAPTPSLPRWVRST